MTRSDRNGRPPLRAPVAIVHRQSGDTTPLPAGPAYILWWDGARAIGHVWRHGDEAVVPPPAPPRSDVTTTIPAHSASVVICTRDRPEALARCLASLTRQTLVPAQVIVVDNASQGDATRQVAMAANVTYRREDRAGLDIARNTGAGAATGDIVVYTDDDVETTDDWLRALVAAFDDPRIDAACGLVLPAVLETEAQLLFEREWGFGRGYAPFTLGPDFHARHRAKGVPSWRLGAGANMAFRRSRLLTLGGFDERLDVGQAGCSGDSELWYRILAGGGSCRYEPDAIVFHHHRRELAALESQIFHYMRGHVAALLVQYERTGEIGNLVRAGFILPRYYLRRAIARAVKGPAPHNAMLRAEIRGAWAGLRFYLKAPRPPYDAVPR